MPRAEVGTPKYIANKMKAKGLQKLRWYCQMCQKQCRDENGFKCHTMSESHQRQLLLFADNSRKMMDEFSYEFQKGFVDILRRQYGTKRVLANRVYQEYIADKHHLHMNATRWCTLTGFVKWLGKTGKCVVDETEKGWFITWIDNDPDTLAMKERKAKKVKMDKDDEERMLEFVQKQVEMGKKESTDEPIYTDLKRTEDDEKIVLKLESYKPKVTAPVVTKPLKDLFKERHSDNKSEYGEKKKPRLDKPRSALDDIIEQEEKKKELDNRKENWITEGIVVKVITKSLGDNYYKRKGYVREVIDKFSAVVKMLDTGHKLKLDQSHLETVIPAVGRLVKVVNGAYRGSVATLVKLDEKNFCVSVEISSGPLKGRVVDKVQYEDISKLHIPEE